MCGVRSVQCAECGLPPVSGPFERKKLKDGRQRPKLLTLGWSYCRFIMLAITYETSIAQFIKKLKICYKVEL